MPSVGIYLPPAARKLDQNAADVGVVSPPVRPPVLRKSDGELLEASSPPSPMQNPQVEIKRSRQRRPDMAVYVPPWLRNAPEPQRPRKLEALHCSHGVELQLGSPPYQDWDVSDTDKKQRLSGSETPQAATDENKEPSAEIDNHTNVIIDIQKQDDHKSLLSEPQNEVTLKYHDQANDSDSSGTSSISIECNEYRTDKVEDCSSRMEQSAPTQIETPFQLLNHSNEEIKSPAALREIIPKNIEVQEDTKIVPMVLEEKTVSYKPSVISVTIPKVETISKDAKLDPDEQDWDTLYDDSGECLEPSLMTQLTSAVGQVVIETPKSSFDDYKHKNLEDEFPHVVEVYNFPPEFKTPDLVMVFSDFKNSGFEIQWVDDTHALGVFSNPAIVSEVLSMQHPLVKTRCLSEGSPQSKSKARRCADALTPYTVRPETCPALARRLVTGALGVKLPTQRAEREAERKLLREAREKKKLAAKQREEAWEGTFS